MRALTVAMVLAIGAGCDDGPQRVASRDALRAEVCSDTDVTAGVMRSSWILKSEVDNVSPVRSISTTDLAPLADGTVFIADRREAKVIHLAHDGTTLAEWGALGDGPGEFRWASAIAVTNDRAYVADRSAGRITVFSLGGNVVRTISASRTIRDISDLLVLPNGNIVISSDVLPGERTGPYVAIVDSTGAMIHDVLSATRPEAGTARPLLGHRTNPVRLTSGPNGQFAVWYPMDNYVETFDSSGTSLRRIEGCLPASLIEKYDRQRREGRDAQTMVVLTLGVSLGLNGDVRVASFYRADNGDRVRVRRYSNTSQEIEARDFDTPGPLFYSRLEFFGDSAAIAFNASAADLGIRYLQFR